MKDYKVETKPSYWHVTLSHGEYSDYSEDHYFFAGNDENEVWNFLCRYIEESITENNEYLWGCDKMALKWDDNKYLSPKYTGDKEDVNWSDRYNINNVEIKRLEVIYFKR